MPTHDHSAHDTTPGTATTKMSRRSKWVFGGFAGDRACPPRFRAPRVHLAGWLPWLILLACPLMRVHARRAWSWQPRHKVRQRRRK